MEDDNKDTALAERVKKLSQIPANKYCCDCKQPGTTYINTTVGSFICMTCSGHLRGLNPPHRVKSISMSTFSRQEVDFIAKNGNEICNRIWLGKENNLQQHYDNILQVLNRKLYLLRKYEYKLWRISDDKVKLVYENVKPEAPLLESKPSVAIPSGSRVVPRPLVSVNKSISTTTDHREAGGVTHDIAEKRVKPEESLFSVDLLDSSLTAAGVGSVAGSLTESQNLDPVTELFSTPDQFTHTTVGGDITTTISSNANSRGLFQNQLPSSQGVDKYSALKDICLIENSSNTFGTNVGMMNGGHLSTTTGSFGTTFGTTPTVSPLNRGNDHGCFSTAQQPMNKYGGWSGTNYFHHPQGTINNHMGHNSYGFTQSTSMPSFGVTQPAAAAFPGGGSTGAAAFHSGHSISQNKRSSVDFFEGITPELNAFSYFPSFACPVNNQNQNFMRQADFSLCPRPETAQISNNNNSNNSCRPSKNPFL